MTQYIDINTLLLQRCAGVLAHITSLPGDPYLGYLGAPAFDFIDKMSSLGLRIWQTLPIGPTRDDLSPYQSYSTHAGNIDYIDLHTLIEEQYLTQTDIAGNNDKHNILRIAYINFCNNASQHTKDQFDYFIYDNKHWLYDFALYEIIHKRHASTPWWLWPEKYKQRNAEELESLRKQKNDIQFIYFQQFIFFKQWCTLKKYANKKNMLLFGDIPIYVSHDSADVWQSPDYFLLNTQGEMKFVAGVPPDYFSDTGQRWNNPLYNWHTLERDNFIWWQQRITSQLKHFDIVRIDHFRAFSAYWKIPIHTEHATEGYWESAPGHKLFTSLTQHFGKLPFIAEDLGYITSDVHELKNSFNIPGMAVAQFGFDHNPENPHAPHNYCHNTVAYSGTHDNDTLAGWIATLNTNKMAYLHDYIGNNDHTQTHDNLIKNIFASRAGITILPIQDILKMDSSNRMNTPGLVNKTNWRWQLKWEEAHHQRLHTIKDIVHMYNRYTHV